MKRVRFDTFPYRFEIKRPKRDNPFRFYEIHIYLAGNTHLDAIPLKDSAFADILPIPGFKSEKYDDIVEWIGITRKWLRNFVAARGTESFKFFLAAD